MEELYPRLVWLDTNNFRWIKGAQDTGLLEFVLRCIHKARSTLERQSLKFAPLQAAKSQHIGGRARFRIFFSHSQACVRAPLDSVKPHTIVTGLRDLCNQHVHGSSMLSIERYPWLVSKV